MKSVQDRLTERENAKNQITAYAYDLQGRLVTNSYYPNSGSYPSSPSKTVSYSYDHWGRMTSWSVAGGGDPGFSGSYAYDETNRIRTVTVNYGAFSRTYTCAYDGFGRKTSFTGPSGVSLQYTYDAQGHLTGLTIPGEGTVSYSYMQGMRLSSILPGGMQKTFGYDPMSAMITNISVDPAGNPIMSRAYQRNVMQNIIGQNTEQRDYAYDYDSVDQLTNVSVNGYSGPSGVATNEAFAYDQMGNRITSIRDTNHWSYSANNLNQYSAIISWTNDASRFTNDFAFDLNGNQLVRYQELSDGAIITNHLVWDIENRLVSITNQQGDVANYSYDPFGRRQSKVFNGMTNYYLYGDEGLIAEYDGEGNMTREYGWTPGSLWMNNLVFMKTPGEGTTNYYYSVNDHLGSLQKLITANGSVAWFMAQDTFGRAVVSSNSTVVCNLRFSSQYFDAESGLHYNTHRYYDPEEGRYASPDPAEQTPGLYVFVQNNPVALIDPVGLWGSDVHYGKTKEWAIQLGISSGFADVIGASDDLIDTLYNPTEISDYNFSWHFNRSARGADSRLQHRDKMVELAKSQCTRSRGTDNPSKAATYLGYALHPIQDWVAHGDFNRRSEAPSLAGIGLQEQRHYWHNWDEGGLRTTSKPDDINLDANGIDGMATFSVMYLGTVLSNKDKTFWTRFHPGGQRINLTKKLTKDSLLIFQEYVRRHGKPCGGCWRVFLRSF